MIQTPLPDHSPNYVILLQQNLKFSCQGILSSALQAYATLPFNISTLLELSSVLEKKKKNAY